MILLSSLVTIKIHKDNTCDAFQHIECNTFISEATFANPKYVWTDFNNEINRIYNWYVINKNNGVNSVLCAYSLGKSQRIINALMHNIHWIYMHMTISVISIRYIKIMEFLICKQKD